MVDAPFLPMVCKFEHSNNQALIRNATEADVPQMYSLIQSLVTHGETFTEDEVPSFDAFVNHLINRGYCVIVEDPCTHEWYGYIILFWSEYIRTKEAVLTDLFICMNRKYRQRGMSKNLISMSMRIAGQLGYHYIITDCVIDNVRPLFSATRIGFQVIGSTPKAFYSKVKGRQDIIIILCNTQGLGLKPLEIKAENDQTMKMSSQMSKI